MFQTISSRHFLAAFSLLGLSILSFADDPASVRLSAELEKERKQFNVPGMSVAVVKDGKVCFSSGFGLRDVKHHLPATPTTVYGIGSSTKSFTALLLAQAQADGKLSLTDSPRKYLPNFHLKDASADAKVTLTDLLCHRSGLPRTDLVWYSGKFSRDELVQIVANVEPTAKLGQQFQYQNLMFLFAGMAAQVAYGKPYETLLDERYFTPLGMSHTHATYSGFLGESERAEGYDPAGPETAESPVPPRNIDIVAPAGAISSTVLDLSKYARMLLDNGTFEGKQLFSSEAIAETRKPRIEMIPGTGMLYGFGWMIHPFEGRTLVEHGGNIDGFNAEIALLPKEHLAALVLTNVTSGPLAMAAAETALKAYLPAPKPSKLERADPPFKAKTGDEAAPADFGTFRLDSLKINLKLIHDGKKVFLEQDGQQLPLVLVGHKRYQGTIGAQKIIVTFLASPKPNDPASPMLEVQGLKIAMRRLAPYVPPMTGSALLAKVIDAKGGAEILWNHPHLVIRYHSHLLSDGVDAPGIRYDDRNRECDFSLYFGLGRRFAYTFAGCDGHAAAELTDLRSPTYLDGAKLNDAILASAHFADLEPAKWYKSVTITGEDKIDGEPVLIVEKLPKMAGSKITDYVSSKTFRVLREENGAGSSLSRQEFSDFRNIDGVIIPFHVVSSVADGGKTDLHVDTVSFTERIPDWPFRALQRTH